LPGKLYLVATPIGNLNDLTPRVKAALTESDLVLAEDTRVTVKILNHLGIQRRLLSCHEHNELERTSLIVSAAEADQSIALVSDAGTPLVSDPGFQIVQKAIKANMTIVPVPGPSAFLLALIGSGLPLNKFVFEGFLPDKLPKLRERLSELENEERTLIFYVSPHKLEKTLLALSAILGDRQVCLARELTKVHEEFLRGSVSNVLNIVGQRQVLGECVLVVAGALRTNKSAEEADSLPALRMQIEALLAEGKGVKEISQECSDKFGWKRSRIYELANKLRQSRESESQAGMSPTDE
jgi:16S rRNA (cytidine1402-2'-O)-methyltransferase